MTFSEKPDAGSYSAEVTAKDTASLTKAAASMQPGMVVYVADIPGTRRSELVETCRVARALGLEPVPHLVARNFQTTQELEETLGALREQAKLTRALVLAGDRDDALGPYADALQLINSGLLQENGIRGISIACYPEGHPRISDAALSQALTQKLAAAQSAGLAVHLVSQICFDPSIIVQYVKHLRDADVDAPLRVGVVGPTKLTTLIKYAATCGLGASWRSFSQRPDLHKRLLSRYQPLDLLADISRAVERDPALNIVGAHLFTFGALNRSIDWIQSTDASALPYCDMPRYSWA